VIYTIGHSTHPPETFLELLRTHGVGGVADVRIAPWSRRHPHFSQDALARFLAENGVVYRHFRDLGGLRKPRKDSINTAWQHASFRGYADYMETLPFRAALDSLILFAAGVPTAIMCAEAVWWQCHRRLLADALVVRGLAVHHILSASAPKAHQLSEFARIEGSSIAYPGLL